MNAVRVRMTVFLTLILLSATCSADPSSHSVNDAPLVENWAPGEWGAEDSVGAVNRITPELILKAVKLVKQGKVATLGKVYSSDMPLYGNRKWQFRIDNIPPNAVWGNLRGFPLDDYLEASIGQVGTQFDGPGHIGVRTSKGHFFYNGRFLSNPNINTEGLGPLGVEHVAEMGFVCRGVLLDATSLYGGPLPVPESSSLDDSGIVGPEDIKKIIKQQGIDPIKEGDCVFLYTGHGDLWDTRLWGGLSPSEKERRTEQFHLGEPGFGISACEYLAARKIVLTGADSWGVEAFLPGGAGERGDYLECHIELQTKHGIWNLENLDFSQLLRDKVYEFLFVWSPLKIKGGTGSPGNPVAIY